MSEDRYFYVTTPIFYVNDQPHLGHCYTVIAADILARFWRMAGYKVKFLTGTDEHGAKVAQAAEKKGVTPQAYVDEVSQTFKEMTGFLKATNDQFIRTTDSYHQEAAEALWKKLEAQGQIYLGPYAGWYAVRDEAFYEESEIKDGLAPTGAPVEWIEEPCYFFRLSHWQEALLTYYRENPLSIAPKSRYNETVSFIERGLMDLAISRSRISWGIPVPNSSNHVMYVWIDALTNYISALGYPQTTNPDFQNFWPKSLHLLAKDILIFHSVYWPAFLMAAGLPVPHRLFVHGWWTRDKVKMSKSLGNVVNPQQMIHAYGLDAFRYFLFREVPFGQDGDFSEKALSKRLNEDLANDLGNLAQRVLFFLQKHHAGKIPPLHSECVGLKENYLLSWGLEHKEALTERMKQQDIYHYLRDLMEAVQEGNRFMAELAPWTLIKKGTPEAIVACETGVHVLLVLLRDLAVLFSPIIPEASGRLLSYLAEKGELSLENLGAPLTEGTDLPAPSILFNKTETAENHAP